MSSQYDVFISFRSTGDDGLPTRDRVLARGLFDILSAAGLTVFFSEESLKSGGVDNFRRAIDDALDSAQILIAVGTCAENFETQWVAYEWRSFSNDVLSGVRPNARLFVYLEGQQSSPLPRALRHCQTFLHSPSEMERVLEFVQGALGRATTTPDLDALRSAEAVDPARPESVPASPVPPPQKPPVSPVSEEIPARAKDMLNAALAGMDRLAVDQTFPAIVDVIDVAIQNGAPAYNEGRIRECACTYQFTATEIVERLRGIHDSGELLVHGPELALRLLKPIVQRNPLVQEGSEKELAWDLRHAFDATVHSTIRDGGLALIDRVFEASVGRPVDQEFFSTVLVAAIQCGNKLYERQELYGVSTLHLSTARRLVRRASELGVARNCVEAVRRLDQTISKFDSITMADSRKIGFELYECFLGTLKTFQKKPKSEFHVFISYRRSEMATARLFQRELEVRDLKVFLDVDGIDAGGRFDERIQSVIRDTPVFLPLLTNDFFER